MTAASRLSSRRRRAEARWGRSIVLRYSLEPLGGSAARREAHGEGVPPDAAGELAAVGPVGGGHRCEASGGARAASLTGEGLRSYTKVSGSSLSGKSPPADELTRSNPARMGGMPHDNGHR